MNTCYSLFTERAGNALSVGFPPSIHMFLAVLLVLFASTAPAQIQFTDTTSSANLPAVVKPSFGASWGDLESDILENSPTDSDFIFGANLGVVVPIGEGNWGFAGSFSYLLSDIALEGGSSDIGVDPVMLKFGLAYSF